MWALRHRKREWNTNHFVVCTDGDNFVYFESIVGDSGGVKVDIIILKGWNILLQEAEVMGVE